MDKYVIHTRHRKDRYQLFTKELEEQQCSDYQIIEGRFDPVVPIQAISEAHKQAVQCAICNKSSSVLIMENDVRFTSSQSLNRLIELSSTLPDDWDIFLGGISAGLATRILPGISKVTKFTGFFCYIVRDKFYEKFLSADPNMNIDHWVGHLSGANAYFTQPMIAMTYSGFSDNVRRIVSYDKHFQAFELWDSKK